MLPVLLAATLLAAPVRPFEEERLLLDRRLETLKRILPDNAGPAADAALLREIADRSRLTHVETVPRQPTETGAKGEVVVDLTAFARFSDVDLFFRQVASHHRLIDVQNVTLAATNQDVLKVTTSLALPYRAPRASVPPPPDGLVERPRGVPRPQADAFVRDQALALAKSEQIATWRRSRRNPRLFLAELAAATRDRPVTLTFASSGDEFVVRGLTVGEGPARALESRLENGFFRVASFLMARSGACRQFEVRGAVPVAGPEAELPLPAEDPFEQDEAPCRVERDPGAAATWIRAGGAKNASGALTVRARDLDAADIFLVVHDAAGLGFLVDGSVSGRYSLELSRVSVEEALAAIRKAGLGVSDRGLVRRVSPSRMPATTAPETTGGPASGFAIKRTDVRDILAAMAEMDPSLGALGPPGALGRVSLWATNQPLFELRSTLLESVGLGERVSDEGQRILFRKADPTLAPVAVAAASSQPRLSLRPQDLTTLEFEPRALSSDGIRWTAWAYAATGHLFAYRSGDRLADASVKSVESNEVVLDTDEGPLRLALSDAPR